MSKSLKTSNETHGTVSSKTEKQNQEKTTIKALGFLGVGGGAPCMVDYRDGKVIRIRPLHYDWKYDRKELNPWKFDVRGKVLEPSFKSCPSPFSLAYKKRAFSPNRIKYPLKRVDWDPEGERNTHNRGKSKFRRISWDEATGIISTEIKRIHQQYGPYAILAQVDGHGECKSVHAAHGQPTLLLDKLGGFTQQTRNPDSWEGWYYGAMHVWGVGYRGLQRPVDNSMKDIAENCQMILYWGCDPETTPWGFSGQTATRFCYYWSELGIKQVYICPDLNYGAAVHADKWIPVLPNTDAALQLAIIYVWITEGTYDKEYIKTHTVGMEKVEDYVLGREDGVPKTPDWASARCGVPSWTIKALARQFASKRTSIAHFYGGSYIRGPYSHEPARLECILLGMQGLGKPGVNQFQIGFNPGMPRAYMPGRPDAGQLVVGLKDPDEKIEPLMLFKFTANCFTKQAIPKTYLQDAILNPPVTFWGTGGLSEPPENQFVKYTYPIPKEEGGTEIHMVWTDTPCRTTCWNDGMHTVEALRSPKIECVVAQHPWLENDCLIADIILPANTTLEVDDLVSCAGMGANEFSMVGLQKRAMEPVGESKSDYEIVLEIARKMGMEEKVSEGKSVDEWIKAGFDRSLGRSTDTNWEKFQEKGYYVFPTSQDWEKDPPGMIEFYQDPVKNPMPTPTGKLEFYSESIAKAFPCDMERSPIPRWVEKSETHDERISSDRARMFPLLMMSNHGRWRVHAQCDDIPWSREVLTCKVTGPDGYKYEPIWINPADAKSRGIKTGDIVKALNERGVVLCGALVWERIMPGAVYVDHGARTDFIIPGKVDRGGAVNLISPRGTASKNCLGQATSGYLVDVQKVTQQDYEKWRQIDPEAFDDAFSREYDPAAGLRFNAWVE
ncbi:MAG: molybdopterin-dependent oxidoreductase [Dehalococcoidales bacterium]|nr:molybdopterin-dependent oxidoreductase [Dehalococcoidales bacterium]